MKRVYLVAGLCLLGLTLAFSVGCSENSGSTDGGTDGGPVGPFADPWTVMPTSELPVVRGFATQHGIIHCHSPYSHDACDDEGFVDGVRDEECFQDIRDGLCETAQDFVFLTDHRGQFADYEYPDVLLYAEGDTLIERGGMPVANRVACPGGHQVIVAAGTESGMMPIGLEHHVGDTPAERSHWYGLDDEEGVLAMQDAGGLVFLQHTEGWPLETILGLPIDGIENYNLHQNMMDNLAGAIEMALLLESDPESIPAVELAIITVFQESEADLYRWAMATQQRHMPGVLATDSHRNVFPNPSPDGERLDSYRRMMHWFSNYLLVPEGPVDDAVLKEAIAHGRMYGVFDYLGYAVGFDFRAETGGQTYEMGDSVPAGGQVDLVLEVPAIYRLDPALDTPDIYGRILQGTAEGTWEEVATGAGPVSAQVQAGVYRAEVRMVPHHLRPWLGDMPDYDIPDKFIVDTVWVYSNPIYVE